MKPVDLRPAVAAVMVVASLAAGCDPPPVRKADAAPCTEPVGYRIGTIDQRFTMTEAEFGAAITEATGVWSSAAGRTLFRYDPKAELVVNLAYDWRQQKTQEEAVVMAQMAKLNESLATLEHRLERMNANLLEEQRQRQHELEDFNSRIQAWNARGGAPPDVLARMRSEKTVLQGRMADFEAGKSRFNRLVVEHNALIETINDKARALNGDGLVGTEFMKGIYVLARGVQRIDIFQYREHDDLLVVLAHEFGHALGLHHSDDDNSIMSPTLKIKAPALSPDDQHALRTFCAVGY